jgi:hypothetical protein
VVVRQIPLVTAAYGTRVARPARTTMLPPLQQRLQLGRKVRPVPGDQCIVDKSPEGSRHVESSTLALTQVMLWVVVSWPLVYACALLPHPITGTPALVPFGVAANALSAKLYASQQGVLLCVAHWSSSGAESQWWRGRKRFPRERNSVRGTIDEVE